MSDVMAVLQRVEELVRDNYRLQLRLEERERELASLRVVTAPAKGVDTLDGDVVSGRAFDEAAYDMETARRLQQPIGDSPVERRAQDLRRTFGRAYGQPGCSGTGPANGRWVNASEADKKAWRRVAAFVEFRPADGKVEGRELAQRHAGGEGTSYDELDGAMQRSFDALALAINQGVC